MIASLYAVDFTQMSTEDMMQMRGNVPVDQRDDFRQEMQKRMQSMTPQERQKYGMQGKGMMGGQGMMGNQGMMGGQGMHCCCCCCCCCRGMMGNQGMMGGQGIQDKGMKCGGQGMKQGQGMMMNNQ